MNDAIGWATRYTALGASSRLRHYRWAERWRASGATARVEPFFDEAYLRRLYGGGGKSPLALAAAWRRRWRWLKQAPAQLVIEYELLPFVPWRVERAALRGRRYVVDFDDNVWCKYAHLPLLRDKFDQVVRHAAAVIVANDFLYDKVAALNPNAVKIPTLIDAVAPRPECDKFAPFTVVWIGTPVTYGYLEQAAPALRAMAAAVDFELLVVADRRLAARPIPGVRMRWIDWSEAAAADALARSQVGIMPLPDEAFARGKSAYKLIQYQGAGLPAIASPVGENGRVIRSGENGFLAAEPAEWAAALLRLSTTPELRLRMGALALAHARQYTFDANQERYFATLKAAFCAKK